MQKLKINPEFEKLCRRLSTDEFDRLEKNIIECGCLDPILLWNGFIVDGHNRYTICKKHNIEFRIKSLAFDSKDDVMSYMINNQLGRRNLSDLDKVALLAHKEPILKKQAKERQRAAGGDRKSESAKSVPSKMTKAILHFKGGTREILASEAGVSTGQYSYLKAINEKGTEDLKQAVRDKKISASSAAQIARYSEEEQPEQVKSMIEQKEKRKEKKPDEEKPKKVILTKAIMDNVPEMAYQYTEFAKSQLERIQKGDKSAIPALKDLIKHINSKMEEFADNEK